MREIFLEYEDGRTVRVQRNTIDLADAVEIILDLADRAGKFVGDGHGPPVAVRLYRQGLLELRIAVLRGGLIGL